MVSCIVSTLPSQSSPMVRAIPDVTSYNSNTGQTKLVSRKPKPPQIRLQSPNYIRLDDIKDDLEFDTYAFTLTKLKDNGLST